MGVASVLQPEIWHPNMHGVQELIVYSFYMHNIAVDQVVIVHVENNAYYVYKLPARYTLSTKCMSRVHGCMVK